MWSVTVCILLATTVFNQYVGAASHCEFGGDTGETVSPYWTDTCGCSQFEDAGFPPTELQERIVTGWEVRFNELPYQALIENRTGLLTAEPICGGVLINTKWVLTSAGCVADLSLDTMQVVLGEHRRQSSNPFREEINPTSVVIHPDYQPSSEAWGVEYNDIAMIELERLVPTTPTKYPICRPPGEAGVAVNETNGIVCGWGGSSPGEDATNELRCTYLDFVTTEDCQLFYEDPLDDGMFCAFTQGRDVCNYDRGGAISVKADGHFHVLGISSWSEGCSTGPPSVFTDVQYYYEWINSVILAAQ